MIEQTHDPDALSALGDDECWEVLRANQLGHLAYVAGGEPDIVPVNYLESEGRLLFRTAEGSKLLGVTMHESVAFEVDEIAAGLARTVIVYGHAERVSEAEEDRADELPLRPWVPTLKYNVVAIVPRRLSGRGFRLDRPGSA